MDTSNMSVDEQVKALGITNNDDLESFNLTGKYPEELKNFTTAADIILQGVTIQELCDRYGTQSFDLNLLIHEFCKACPDYSLDVGADDRSKSLEFAALTLYRIGPETRSVKKPGQDKRWRMRLTRKVNIQNVERHLTSAIFVCTYKNNEAPKQLPTYKDNKIVLTIKQASLLAIHKITTVVEACLLKNIIIMTPLAGAIFSKNDLDQILQEVNDYTGNKYTKAWLISTILASCQSGGQYLNDSDASMAVAASVCATQNIKDVNLKYSIIGKTFKQYNSAQKPFDNELYKIYCKYATGGVPSEYKPENLVEIYNKCQNFNIRHRQQLKDNTLRQKDYEAEQLDDQPSGSKGAVKKGGKQDFQERAHR